ncbi:RHS repeat-associated core domain-containing protein [uncultured Clostridium sp.]|uniref:RHS repeat-associated core domain-containing protein n=1 Tax=uncultured Clostridium sp. TaxID=59620 RepID=UPI0028EFA5B5|nr:RHS repeat-associated core domain-containing protein [uncultured Clostridium sp.]
MDLDESENSNLPLEAKYNKYFYTVDEQGSTVFITDENQRVRNEYYYDAFGNVLSSKEEIHNRITYTGQQFDGITQQYYLRARFYNPVIGRFTQEDVYRGDGLNLYAYCGNNPVVYYDPSGYASNSGKCWSKENPFNLNDEKEKYSDKAKQSTKINRDYIESAQNSDILRSELKNAGIQPPPYGNAAHHIVAADAPDAQIARNILSEYGIDYNSASNGVFLPYKKNDYVSTETMHVGSHNGKYYEYVNNQLQQAIEEIEISGGTVRVHDITNTLDNIRKGLLNGTVKLNNPK